MEKKIRSSVDWDDAHESRGLLSDPPLLDRLTWREGIRPQTLISDDRGLMARTFGPRWFFHAALAFGTGTIAAATIVGPTGAEGVNALWCAWVVVLAFLFFQTRGAVAQTAFAIGAYGFARRDRRRLHGQLSRRDDGRARNLWRGRRTAAALSASIRAIDLVARLGGEEFAVLLPDANRMEAYVVAERVRHGILDAFIDHEVPITGSCGVATFNDHTEQRPDQLMGAADAALYQAEALGRNCTVSAEEKEPQLV
jgi:hypothetical protein